MLELVTGPEKENESEISNIVITYLNKIVRHKQNQVIFSRSEQKEYKLVYDKRVIQDGTWDTLPYGY